jgi:agmatinase
MIAKPKEPQPFYGTSLAHSAQGAHAAIFGAPHGTPYGGIDNRYHAASPDAFRAALQEDAAWIQHYDFDFGGRLFPGANFRAVDLGNLKTRSADGPGNREKIETLTRSILNMGAVPLLFGGDDSVPIPFLRGFAEAGPITVVQIDAHIDWRHEREGETEGFSSTMRRASEMGHIAGIVQAGARGIGSARDGEVADAEQWGARIVTSRSIHLDGSESVLRNVDENVPCVICLDLDALDPSVMPAVAYPSPGGLSFFQVTELIAGLSKTTRIAGFSMVEFVPERDHNGTAAFAASRIAAHVLGHIARQTRSEA